MPGRILIADDLATNRIILNARLSAAAYQITQATSGAEALALAARTNPDLLILSGALRDIDGPTMCRRVRSMPGMADTPVIVTGALQTRQARLAALQAGADAVFGAESSVGLLQARIRNILRRRAAEQDLSRGDAPAFGFADAAAPALTPPGQIALIAQSPAEGLDWKLALGPLIRDRITVMCPGTALAELNPTAAPDAFVIAGASGSALRLIADLRSRAETLHAAILMQQDGAEDERVAMALDLGVTDLIETGFDAVELALRLRRELARKARNERARATLKDGLRLAATDPLTGLYNRRYVVRELDQASARAEQGKEPFAVMMLDLDRFKRVNDTYGHAAGDAVLTEVARRMLGCLRHEDVLARIGGEEFLAVIRRCDVQEAQRAAERLRRAVSANAIVLPGDAGVVKVTVSVGLAIGTGEPAGALIDRADRALYAAKADGRDQVTLARCAA